MTSYVLVLDLVDTPFYLLRTFLPEILGEAQHETMHFHTDGIYRRSKFLPDIFFLVCHTVGEFTLKKAYFSSTLSVKMAMTH